jgi:prepilin peptidase CpaA
MRAGLRKLREFLGHVLEQGNRMTLHPQLGLCLAIGAVATAEDLWRRQISNWIPATGLLLGLGWQVYRHGWWGLAEGLAGSVVGFLVFLVFYVLGGMGGGDVKLMAAFGALLGWRGVLWASLWTAAAGGILALLAIVARRAWRWFARRVLARPEAGPEDDSIPYAPAITVGAVLGWASITAL